jgi:biotin-dependent carboxylase-like uncharacterized protein
MHEGVPPGGALVPELLARANAAAGNGAGAAALELFGSISLEARGEALVATDDGTTHALADGARLDVPAPATARVRYLAVRGGLDVPKALGSRGTLVTAQLGGHEGRWLRGGDALAVGRGFYEKERRGEEREGRRGEIDIQRTFSSPLLVKILRGPDRERFAADAVPLLVSSVWTVSSASDRVGIRLEGPHIPRVDGDLGVSAPMVRGAIQVPAGGAPIVLGPDHPTTGGYPVVAVVASASFGAFAARRAGETVRFRVVR